MIQEFIGRQPYRSIFTVISYVILISYKMFYKIKGSVPRQGAETGILSGRPGGD
jgi:hypothetical protein